MNDYPQMSYLAQLFPTLRAAPGVEPFDAEKLLRWCATSPALTAGGAHAIAFLLSVYNPDADWRLEAKERGLDAPDSIPFDAVRAMRTWDAPHRRAFLVWAEKPVFP